MNCSYYDRFNVTTVEIYHGSTQMRVGGYSNKISSKHLGSFGISNIFPTIKREHRQLP